VGLCGSLVAVHLEFQRRPLVPQTGIVRAERDRLAVIHIGGLGRVLARVAGSVDSSAQRRFSRARLARVVRIERVQLARLLQLAFGLGQQLIALGGGRFAWLVAFRYERPRNR